MRTMRKLTLLCLAAIAALAMTATSASAVTVTTEVGGTSCGTGVGICKIEGHDIGGARFHDVIGFVDGTCDVELEGLVNEAGHATTTKTPVITNCVGSVFTACPGVTWELQATTTTTAEGDFCVDVQPFGPFHNECHLVGMVIEENKTNHDYQLHDTNPSGEQSCEDAFYEVNVELALEVDAAHPEIEIK
jgi:hypothetical protein